MAAVTRELFLTYGSVAVGSVAASVGTAAAYTMENTNGDSTVPSWIIAGAEITFYGCTNAANNGTFAVVSVVGLVVTVTHSTAVLEAASPGSAAHPVAGASNYHMHEKYKFGSGYKIRSYDFDAVITSTTLAQFNARCLSIERAFRVPRQRLRVLLDTATMDDLNPTAASGGNTGFNAEPQIQKVGDIGDTGRSRHYHISIEVQLPADLAGQSGRQDSTVDVTFLPSRARVITISGRYTALGSNNARAQYNASIDTYTAAVRTAIANGDGSVYERVGETASSDDADKNLDFTQVFEEVFYAQSSGGMDHASIVQGRYNYRRQQVAPGDSDSSARRLENLEADFECWVDKTVTVSLNGLWEGTIRPYILSEVKRIYGASACALVDADVHCEQAQNRITGRLMIQAVPRDGGGLVQFTKTERVEALTGKQLVPTWAGSPLAKHVYSGPADIIRTITSTALVLGSASGAASGSNSASAGTGASFGGGIVVGNARAQINFSGGFQLDLFGPNQNSGAAQTALVEAVMKDDFGQGDGAEAPSSSESGWILMRTATDITPIFLGLPPDQLTLTEIKSESEERWADPPGAGGGGEAT